MEELQEAMKTNMIMAAKTKTALNGLFNDVHRAVNRCKTAFNTTKEIVSDFVTNEQMRAQVYRENLHQIDELTETDDSPTAVES